MIALLATKETLASPRMYFSTINLSSPKSFLEEVEGITEQNQIANDIYYDHKKVL